MTGWLADPSGPAGLALYGALAGLSLVAAVFWFLLRLLRQNGQLLVRLETLEQRTLEADSHQDPTHQDPDPLAALLARGGSDGGSLPTLVALSVTTVRKDLIYRRWAREGRLPPGLTPPAVGPTGDSTPAAAGPARAETAPAGPTLKRHIRVLADGEQSPVYMDDEATAPGVLAIYDWESRELTWLRSWGPRLWAPFGYCFADGVLYLLDSWGCGVFRVDVSEQPGRLLGRISHPYLNDAHSIERTRRGLLITSTGCDVVLELDLDGTLLFEWWAAEHGYSTSPSGVQRTAGRGQDHRDLLYHTTYQTTHLNEALFRDPDERYLLVSLFHQGQIVQIDRALPPAQQGPEVLLDGLRNPHGLRKAPFGWLVTSSTGGEVLLLDDDFRVFDRLRYETSWIQDCALLSSGDLLLNDINRARLVQFTGPPWRPASVIPYPELWRGCRVFEVPPEYQAGFPRAAAPLAARR